MMTLRQLAAEPPTLPTRASWYLAELAESKGKQELFTRQAEHPHRSLPRPRRHAAFRPATGRAGDLFEYVRSKLNTAGQNGQFRTPRHIIRMMVQMIDPRPGERMCDPAAGTCGFPVNVWQHIPETHTDPRDLTYDEDGYPHGFTGSKLTKEEWQFSQTKALTGYDSDAGIVMLRIGCLNLMLHGIEQPNFRCVDTLSKPSTRKKPATCSSPIRRSKARLMPPT